MNTALKAIVVTPKTGNETFHSAGQPAGFNVLDFWRWSTSDLLINITRGIVAEFIVAQALKAKEPARIEWAPYDLTTPEGIAVEVKSAAYFQSWDQDKLSAIQFSVLKSTPLDESKGGYHGTARRPAAVYVFALLEEREDKTKVDPLNLEQWKFYVVTTKSLNERKRSQQSITLHSLENEKELNALPAKFNNLRNAVLTAAGKAAGK